MYSCRLPHHTVEQCLAVLVVLRQRCKLACHVDASAMGLLPVYRNGVDSRQLQLLHCAAADWQWGMRDGSTAAAWVSRHYAAACNAEALFHGEMAAAHDPYALSEP